MSRSAVSVGACRIAVVRRRWKASTSRSGSGPGRARRLGAACGRRLRPALEGGAAVANATVASTVGAASNAAAGSSATCARATSRVERRARDACATTAAAAFGSAAVAAAADVAAAAAAVAAVAAMCRRCAGHSVVTPCVVQFVFEARCSLSGTGLKRRAGATQGVSYSSISEHNTHAHRQNAACCCSMLTCTPATKLLPPAPADSLGRLATGDGLEESM